MKTTRAWWFGVPLAMVMAAGCGGDDEPTSASDAGADSSVDSGPPTRIEEIPRASEPLALEGLEASVEVVRDERGMPHIYGENLHDVFLAQGYVMARDRFPAMELVRRQVTGRIAEFASDLDPSSVDGDILARWVGHKRNAEAIYASLDPDGDEKMALEAFAAGVNLRIAEIRTGIVDGTYRVPVGAELFNLIALNDAIFTDWTATDTLAIGRYLSHSLSDSASDEIALTAARAAVRETFPSDSSNAALAARAGAFQDLWMSRPAGETIILPPDSPSPLSGSRAGSRFPGVPLPSRETLASAQTFASSLSKFNALLFGEDQSRGSNNWVVSGTETASGAPIVANDPHLALGSPPLFWYVHLNTKRSGGTLDAQGLALMGVPGIILGYNDRVAWGVTTAYIDVTDVYAETIAEGTAGGADTVLFNDTQVPIETVTEQILLADGSRRAVTFERVPHHGLIVPTVSGGNVVPRTGTSALSVKWTGNEVSNELGAFLRLNLAQDLDEAKAAIATFEVGAQSFVVATRDGDIHWTQHARIPVRSAESFSYDAETGEGIAPMLVMPGTGDYEWTGTLAAADIPQATNPAQGFIATANNDAVGVWQDGDPTNDEIYLGADYAVGYRGRRITEELRRLTAAGDITPEQMSALQNDTHSNAGADYSVAFADAADRLAEEAATPGTHPDLADLADELDAPTLAKIADMSERVREWSTSLATPAAVEGAPTSAEITDSVATTIFNVTLAQFLALTFDDELDELGVGLSSGYAINFLKRAFNDPESLATYRDGQVAIFDDLRTEGVTETRDERIARAFVLALAWLEDSLATTVTDWRWGKLHTLRFASLIPNLSSDALSIPPSNDPTFPAGFPRHGDMWAVDVGNYSLFAFRGSEVQTTAFATRAGAQQRLVVEMTTDGPRAWNALPGGQILDSTSPHFRDEAELWRRNEAPPLFFTEADVIANYESRETLTP